MSMETTVERVTRAIERAGFEWKSANGGDDASFADIPEEVFARAAIAAMPGWQPIASAPKDGTEIILGDHGGSYAGYWSTAECRRIPSSSEGNWFDECDRGNEVCARPSRPIHWMPMPDPPALSDPAPAPRDGNPS